MLKLIKFKNLVFTRPALYSDWRDWFIRDEYSVPIDVYKTKMQIFFDKEYIGEAMIPINIKTFRSNIQIETDKNLYIDKVKFFIPEMGIVKEFDSKKQLSAGDTLSFSGEIFFFD